MNASAVRLAHELPKILVGPVARIHVVVVHDVVAVIAHRLRDRHQPDAPRSEVREAVWVAIVNVVETCGESAQVPNPVGVGIGKGADEYLVADAVPPPLRRIARRSGPNRRLGAGKREKSSAQRQPTNSWYAPDHSLKCAGGRQGSLVTQLCRWPLKLATPAQPVLLSATVERRCR